jgi:uncharacterized protein
MLIDCDVHNAVSSDEELRPYLPRRWREHLDLVGSRTFSPFTKGYAYPKAARFASRRDAWPPTGGLPGSDLEFMRAQLLDAYDVEYACSTASTGHRSSATTRTGRRWPPR